MNIIALIIIIIGVVESSRYGVNKDVVNHPNWFLIDHEQCGESFQDRIIGGSQASLGEYPWMARIGISSRLMPIVYYSCGGALISDLYVITAAHCVVNMSEGTYIEHIRLGEFDARTEKDCDRSLGVCTKGTQDIKPEHIIVHKDVNSPFQYMHDICLIRLKRRAQMSEFVRPICLPHGKLLNKNLLGAFVEVAGWGLTNTKQNLRSDVVLKVKLPVQQLEMCKRVFPNVSQGQLCIGGQKGFDSCGGDSGGPVMKIENVDNHSPKYYILGLVSFGDPSCGSHNPAVYVDLRRYMIWILDNMRP